MTADTVFKQYRAHKFFYGGKYDIRRYHGNLKCPPLINQPDRRYYYRISTKLNDDQVNGLFTIGLFFNPKAHISELCTPAALDAGMKWASRPENGRYLLETELYTLSKTLKQVDILDWLYGDSAMPPCLQSIIAGELQPDVAALLLLIPQAHLDYHWTQHWDKRAEDMLGIGPGPWIDRLKKLDQLVCMYRPGWRMLSHDLAKAFWAAMRYNSLAPKATTQNIELF